MKKNIKKARRRISVAAYGGQISSEPEPDNTDAPTMCADCGCDLQRRRFRARANLVTQIVGNSLFGGAAKGAAAVFCFLDIITEKVTLITFIVEAGVHLCASLPLSPLHCPHLTCSAAFFRSGLFRHLGRSDQATDVCVCGGVLARAGCMVSCMV